MCLNTCLSSVTKEKDKTMIEKLEAYLSEITGFTACSLQPNSGAQGEYTGLLTIRAYHAHRDQQGIQRPERNSINHQGVPNGHFEP